MAWIVVVGAGPAGLMASAAAAEMGCRVTLIDEAERPGGQIYRQADSRLTGRTLHSRAEEKRKARLLARFEAQAAAIDYRPATVAHSLFPGPELHVAGAETSEALKPDAVILATGVSEQMVPFPGWTLPGVLYAGGAQALMKANLVRPGSRAVVAGIGPLPLAVAAQLVKAGVEVSAVALFHRLSDTLRDPLGLWAGRELVREGLAYKRAIEGSGAMLLEGWMPLRAAGGDELEAVHLAPHKDGRPRRDKARVYPVDLLALNFGFSASAELARMAGARCRDQGARGAWVVECDERGQTSLPGLYVAGDCAGLRGALVAAAEGEIVGAAAASATLSRLLPAMAAAHRLRRRHERFQKALRPLFEVPPATSLWAEPDTLICRCEGVTKEKVMRAVAEGHTSLDAIKRNTRAGMGWCGGKTCLRAVAALAGSGDPGSATEPMRARPVARPVTLAALAEHREGDYRGNRHDE